jgi:hypothetical protein
MAGRVAETFLEENGEKAKIHVHLGAKIAIDIVGNSPVSLRQGREGRAARVRERAALAGFAPRPGVC